MIRTTLLLLALFVLPSTQFGQAIYLKFDPACMDRQEYTTGYNTAPYVSYVLNAGENKKAIFDVGQENAKWEKELPGKLIYCNSLPIDKTLVQQINDEKIKVFMVRESPSYYNVSPVDKASFYQIFSNAIEFLASDADFVLRTDNLVTGVNLARPASKTEVYLERTQPMQCANAYVLNKKDNFKSESYKQYVLLPEAGIVEKSSVTATGTFTSPSDANTLKLDKVNDLPFKDLLTKICDKLQATYYDGSTAVPTGYEAPATAGTTGTAAASGGDPCAPSTVDGLHVVQKGETMYSISKRYGVNIEQLQQWNGLQNVNVISLCQKLYVKAPSTVSTTIDNSTADKGTAPADAKEGYWITAPEIHVVKPAETVAGIAYTYGYTEERFRKMNGLGSNEGLVVGQRLRTSDCVCPTLTSTTKDQPLPYNAETSKIETPANKEDVYYRPVKIHQVKPSETLFSIAKLYNTTVERIQELNGMKKGDNVTPEQRIYVQ
ncbi:MAG: LysM peptidoglycan-binding domain-containing protein [Saprospiraceae bacterium]